MPSIENVSDTARWVALYRAMESERPDALFHDPFARRLAGARGEAIVRELKLSRLGAFAVVVRTKVLDEVILREVAAGVDCVLNLAAGLDTRPYRLDLPAGLRWIEVDFPPMVEAKSRALEGETPRCRLERKGCDLSDAGARRELLREVGEGSKRVLVVSEGLLVYLAPDEVRSLAKDLASMPHFDGWLSDHVGPRMLSVLRRFWGRNLENAEMKFAPADPAAFFRECGLFVAEYLPTATEALRLGRGPVPEPLYRVGWKLTLPFARERLERLGGHLLLRRA